MLTGNADDDYDERPCGRRRSHAPDDGFFDKSAKYIGAFEPGGKDWTAGWTTHDEN